ncbi:excalibur calcium-binding domain-containing protein [Streptomyces sp. NPDC029003]|uniref:excalibur calcium-binding domain-containing protein n=1 Tax=Streptomyces sp. NPDC029003 TaxID=3155125 RepID=UPI0033C83D3F
MPSRSTPGRWCGGWGVRRPERCPSTTTAGGNTGAGGASSTTYRNRSAGAAPIHRGDPGYGRHLDRDGEGVACEQATTPPRAELPSAGDTA